MSGGRPFQGEEDVIQEASVSPAAAAKEISLDDGVPASCLNWLS